MAGYEAENLPMSTQASVESGLRYANNEICYPATLIVGDIVNALQSAGTTDRNGRGHHPDRRTMPRQQLHRPDPQRARQCRFRRRAGYIRIAGSGLQTTQPGFRIPWLRVFRGAIGAVLFTDCLARLYYATAVRETEPGEAASLRDWYLEDAKMILESESESNILDAFAETLGFAVEAFSRKCRPIERPKVGIVGEIFLKFNPFAQKGLIDWLTDRRIEAVSPILTDFFMQGFVNREIPKSFGTGFLADSRLAASARSRAYATAHRSFQRHRFEISLLSTDRQRV